MRKRVGRLWLLVQSGADDGLEIMTLKVTRRGKAEVTGLEDRLRVESEGVRRRTGDNC